MFQHCAGGIFHAHAFGDAPRETFEQGDHLIVEAIIVAEQHFHAGGGGTRDKNLFGGRFDRKDVVFVLQQHHRFSCRAIRQLTMFIAGDHIGGDGCERHIFGGIEHAEFETRAERAFKGAIHIRFGDESTLDGFGNLAEDMIASQVASVLQCQAQQFQPHLS